MGLSTIWEGIIVTSAVCGLVTGQLKQVTEALFSGSTEGIRLSVSMAGPLCLWTGLVHLAQKTGAAAPADRLLRPILRRIFPSARTDPELEHLLSANVCANLLGLGNAATPMGIQAVRRLQKSVHPEIATDELCRLVVLNTASVQLLPTTVAAVRSAAGAASAFDILPCVWISSLCSVAVGLAAASVLGKVCRHE